MAPFTSAARAADCTVDDIVDVTTLHTDPERQFGAVMTVKNDVFRAPPQSHLDRGRRHLAGGIRFRDQGDRTRSRPTVAAWSFDR